MENDARKSTADDPLEYGYRRRGVNLPTKQSIKRHRKSEHKNRAQLLVNVAVTLHHFWYQFASERIVGIPQHNDLERMYLVFLSCYTQFLWEFKKNRKSKDRINKYWHGIRVRMWDENMHIWREISKCYEAIESDHFYDELTRLAVRVGYAGNEMEMFAKGVLNASEHVMHHEISVKKGADKRHAENRSMKNDVFNWLDTHMHQFKSMDAAADAIAGKMAPVKWRTARDWVGEWKKLRSAGTA